MNFMGDNFATLAGEVMSSAIISSLGGIGEELVGEDDLSTDDIAWDTAEASVAMKCSGLAKKWASLDASYLDKGIEEWIYPNGKKMHINLPRGLETTDMSSLGGFTELAEENTKLKDDDARRNEYMKKLAAIFKAVPKLNHARTKNYELPLKTTVMLATALDPNPNPSDERQTPATRRQRLGSHLAGIGVPMAARKRATTAATKSGTVGTRRGDEGGGRGVAVSGVVSVDECIITAIVVEPSSERRVLELALLPSNTLLDLRRAIECPQDDQAFILPASSSSNNVGNESMRDSYFFIEGTFFVDVVNGGGAEEAAASLGGLPAWLSQRAKQTAEAAAKKKNSKGVTKKNEDHPVALMMGVDMSPTGRGYNCPVKAMADARLGELQLRLGVRYLMCHGLGRCQHWVYFSDAHMFHPNVDAPLRQSYPYQLYKVRTYRRKCDICTAVIATQVTYNDRLALPKFTGGPSFFCDQCYHMLHYDENNRLLYDDFAVFPYSGEMTRPPDFTRKQERKRGVL
jgi:snRNA-activating protein complex subunit 3